MKTGPEGGAAMARGGTGGGAEHLVPGPAAAMRGLFLSYGIIPRQSKARERRHGDFWGKGNEWDDQLSTAPCSS